MPNTKISALTAATTPLAGTEVLPIVQSSTTKKVSIADVTAGRAVSASSLTLTTALTVPNGGTGATTLTGYVKGNGTSAFTASATIPNTDISGLGTMSTQNANSVAITGGSINGTTVGATTAAAGKFTTLDASGDVSLGDAATDVVTIPGILGVGITPTTKFQVSGGRATFNANNEKYGVQLNYGSAATGPFIGSPSADTFTVSKADGTELFRVSSAGALSFSTALTVPYGGTGATTLTGYVKGNGTSAMTASATIPGSDISGNISGNAANVTGTVAVGNGGTGATTLTGYVKGNGTSAFTASATIPNTDITGLGTMSTQAASSVAITGGTINGTTIGGSTRAAGSFTLVNVNTGTSSADLTVIGSSTIAEFVKSSTATNASYAAIWRDSADANIFYVRGDGAVAVPKVGNFTTASAANIYYDGTFLYKSTSSLRYKQNVQDAPFGLSDALKLRPVTYEGKSETDAGKTFGGLIAEEVADAGLSCFVEYNADGEPDALHYGPMVALCLAAIKDLAKQNAELAARVASLEGNQK